MMLEWQRTGCKISILSMKMMRRKQKKPKLVDSKNKNSL